MVDFRIADQARNALSQVLLILLRLSRTQQGITPGDLRAQRLRIKITRTVANGAALSGIKTIEKAINSAHDEQASEAIISDAITEACLVFQTETEIAVDAALATKHTNGDAMFGATVDRRQFAVGHGGFHASRIQIMQSLRGLTASTISSKEKHINTVFDQAYVYDCGSEHADAFASARQIYARDYADQLELLVVSHLHADHINGLDKLLGYKVPRIVVLPYLDLEDLACIALRDYESGKFSGSYRAYLRDPVSWWRNHGVETVIFIEPGNDVGGAPDSPLPDRPLGGRIDLHPHEWDFQHPQARLSAMLRKPVGPLPADLKAADPQLVDTDARKLGQSALLAGSGSLFRVEWRHDPQDSWRSADWGLVPYVHPVQDVQRDAFRRALLAHLQLTNPTPNEYRGCIVDELTDSSRAKKLVDLYGDHFLRDHNAVSMSLYSGPMALQGRRERPFDWLGRWSLPDLISLSRDSSLPNGWLGTGDSMLKQQKRRSPWRNFYERFWQHIGALTLPHHGSIHNYHDEILIPEARHLALVTTVEREARVSNVEKTLSAVEARGKIGIVIDDEPATSVACFSERLFRASQT